MILDAKGNPIDPIKVKEGNTPPDPHPVYTGGKGTNDYRMRLLNRRSAKLASDMVMGDISYEQLVRMILKKRFGDGSVLNYWDKFAPNKLRVVLEGRKYRPSKSKSIKDQMVGYAPKICEIYYGATYICDVREDFTEGMVIAAVVGGTKRLLEQQNK